MKSFIRNLALFVCAATIGIAAQGEAKSKHKDKEHKEKSSKSEKKSRKHDKKHRKDVKIAPEEKKEEPKITPDIVIEHPVVELPAIVGERAIK